MSDAQAQLEEVKRLWEEERIARQRLQSEFDVLRGRANGGQTFDARSRSPEGGKRRNGEGEEGGEEGQDDGDRTGKRQRRD